MNKLHHAQLLLLQIDAIQGDAYEGRMEDLLALVNEVLRDSYALAKAVTEEEASKVA